MWGPECGWSGEGWSLDKGLQGLSLRAALQRSVLPRAWPCHPQQGVSQVEGVSQAPSEPHLGRGLGRKPVP